LYDDFVCLNRSSRNISIALICAFPSYEVRAIS